MKKIYILIVLSLLFLTSIFVMATAPTVTTAPATGVEETNATVRGTLTVEGNPPCFVWFEHGLKTTYGNTSFNANFNLAGAIDPAGTYYSVWVNDTVSPAYVFSAGGGSPDGGLYVHTFNGTTFTPVTDTFDGGTYRDVFSYNGTYIYVATQNDLQCYNFDGAALTKDYTSTINAQAVWANVTNVFSNALNVLSVFDTQLNLIETNSDIPTQTVTDIWSDNTYLYVTANTDGVFAFSYEHSVLTLLDSSYAGDQYEGVCGDGTYIYVACKLGGIRAYSFNGTNFTLLDTHNAGGTYRDIWINGSHIYVANDVLGVRAYTFNGTKLSLVETQYDGSSNYWNVWANNTHAFIANNLDGIRSYNVREIRNTGETFNVSMQDLLPGTLYNYRAVAQNIEGINYGSNVVFLTKPNVVTNFNVSTYSPGGFNLTWTKGTGVNNTYIERNTLSSWSRGEGTLVYNDTKPYYNDTDLSMNTLYYYQAWSFANWTYNPTVYKWSDAYATDSNTTNNVEPPYDGSSEYDIVNLKVNLTWLRGDSSTREIVVQNNVSYSTSPTDGWVRQNSTALLFQGDMTSVGYFTIWSYNDSSKDYSVTGLNIDWGALAINVYNESDMSVGIVGWDIEISNSDSTDVYASYDNTNTLYLDINTIPYGVNTIFFITNNSYYERTDTESLYVNNFYDFNYYLAPYTTPTDPGGGDPGGGDDGEGGNTTTTRLYRFRVVDEYNYPINDATVEIRKYNNVTGEYINISTLITSGYGEGDIYLIPNTHYRAFVSKSGYDSDVFDWIPDPSYYGPDYPKILQLISSSSTGDDTIYTFWDLIQFNATMHTNGSMFVNYIDHNANTTNAQFYIYENYNFTETYIGTESTTSNTFSFWINNLNNSRGHEITIYLNHTTLGYEVKSISVGPATEAKYDDGGEIEQKIENVFGPFSLGYVQVFLVYLPLMVLLVLPGPKHPGFAIIMASLYGAFASSFIVVGSILMIIPFAIALGVILMTVKKGMISL